MEVSTNAWHARVYRWWYHMKYGRVKQSYDWNERRWDIRPNNPPWTNLCPYMRAVLFYALPRYLFLSGGRVTIFTWLNVALVPLWLGLAGVWDGAWCTTWIIVYGVLAMLAALVGTAVIIEYLQNTFQLFTPLGPAAKATKHGLETAVNTTAGFFELLGAYLRSGHDRICPEITFKG